MKIRRKRANGLHVLMDTKSRFGRSPAELAGWVIDAGVDVIQLRDKEASTAKLLETAISLLAVTRRRGALMIVNDRVDVAAASGADGVHLGEEDMPIGPARKLVGEAPIIGASAKRLEDCERVIAEGADYIGLGTVFATPSKDDAGEPIGTDEVARVCRAVDLPVIAIGGIDLSTAESVLKAGVQGFAVISAVWGAEDPKEAALSLAEILRKTTGEE